MCGIRCIRGGEQDRILEWRRWWSYLTHFCKEEALLGMRSLVHCIVVHFAGEVGIKLRDLPDSVGANLAM